MQLVRALHPLGGVLLLAPGLKHVKHSGQGPIRSRFEGCVDTLLIPATAGTEITTTATASITAASAAAAIVVISCYYHV